MRTAVASGPINSREQAFRVLKDVAKFFRETEPHSPLSYSIEQVVRWGELPLPELLSELVSDSSARQALFKWVGINTPETKEKYS
jgi:type VI secretion system protein ImpA